MAGGRAGTLAIDRQTTLAARAESLLERLERLAPLILAATIALWIAVVFATSFYKYETYGQGYDQVDFEQAIWNTVHGRVMEDSRFNFTNSVFGMDWMPMLFFFVPFYAIIPSPHTLFFMQVVGTALGAVPVYWLARDRLRSKLAGLGFGLAFLLYPTVLHGVLNPFQVRLFSLTLLLFGFYYFERGNWKLFGACALVAMLARTDVALVVAMFGVYALITRRRWPWVVAPLIVGFGYFALSTFAIVPSFTYPAPAIQDTSQGAQGGIASCWPCGMNPQLAYYAHLGNSGPEIIKNIITNPVHDVQIMFTREKLIYLLSLVIPLLFLSLLSPVPLVLGLPVLMLNLLSLRSSQYNYQFHYSLLLIPGLFASAIYGTDFVRRLPARRRKEGSAAWGIRFVQYGAITLVVWGIIMQVPYKNPAVRAILYHETPARVQAANRLVAMVPVGAKVAASSKLAPHLLPRRYIYNFPPAPYSPYNFACRSANGYVNLDYILLDPAASALEFTDNQMCGKSGDDLLKSLPDWHLVASSQGLELYERK